MQVFTLVAIVCLGAVSAISAFISNEQDGLESLPPDILRHIASQLPADDQYRFSQASPYLWEVLDLNDADILSARLLGQFGKQGCLGAALHIEHAPPGVISEVVQKLLRSAKFDASTVLEALGQAYVVGHCDLVDVLSGYLHTSPSYSDSANAIFGHACDDVTWLATRPLGELLLMHALPRATFLQMLAAKYRDSGYGSFFSDEAWYLQDEWLPWSRSYSTMSHALHLYEKLNSTVDFSPVPFGRIASTQNMSKQTRSTLESSASSRCAECYFSSGPCDDCVSTFPLLQLVLSPGSEMEFFKSASADFKTEFLFQAAMAGHLDWVKFMVNHDLWNDVRMTTRQFLRISTTWSFSASYFALAMRFSDVLAVGDPVLAAFEMIFHHQMKRLPSETSRDMCDELLESYSTVVILSDDDRQFELHRKIISDYARDRDNAIPINRLLSKALQLLSWGRRKEQIKWI